MPVISQKVQNQSDRTHKETAITYSFRVNGNKCFTWLGKSGDGCKPYAEHEGVCGLSAWAHTYQ